MEHLLPGFHVLFAALLVGGQVLLAFAVIPSTWLIDDEGLRRRVTLVVAHRFTWIVGISLVGLIVTGLAQFYTDIFVPPDIRENMTEYHFGRVFMVKMLFVTILIIMIAVHGAVFGQRIGRISDAVQGGRDGPRRARAGAPHIAGLLRNHGAGLDRTDLPRRRPRRPRLLAQPALVA